MFRPLDLLNQGIADHLGTNMQIVAHPMLPRYLAGSVSIVHIANNFWLIWHSCPEWNPPSSFLLTI